MREWGIKNQQINVLYDDLHSSLESMDPKAILAAQLRLVDHYGIERVLLFQQIVGVYGKERVNEVTHGTGRYVF